MPLCADGEGMKWIQAYVTGEKPNLERDSIMYMLMGRASVSIDPFDPFSSEKNFNDLHV